MTQPPIIRSFNHDARFRSSAALNCDEPILFHYTRAAGALGIMESKQLWCTSVHHSNDKQEFKEAFQVVRNVAGDDFRSATPEVRNNFLEHLNALFEQISKVRIYIACFSEAEDLLSQWRGYAEPRGYSLGFSLEKLRSLAATQGFRVADVKYEHSEQKVLFQSVVRLMASKFHKNGGEACERQKMNSALWPFMTQIARDAPLVKHKGFSEEREWRIFSDPFSNTHEKVSFLVRDNDIVPIYKLDIPCGSRTDNSRTREDIALRSFMVGPGGDEQDRSNALHLVVQRYDLYWRLGSTSQVPLR